ncbi:ABC transporter ATP-binding protein [Cellulomonas sp. URHB0016]
MTGTASIADMDRLGADVARPTLRGLAKRWRQRRTAATQLRRLTRYAGWPLTVGTTAVHVVAGAAPVVFMVGTGLALQHLADGGAMPWLVLAIGAFLGQQLLAPVQLVLSKAVARRVDAACITRFTSFALERAELATLERPEVADRLAQADEAFEQWTLTPGTAVEGGLALTARYTQLVGAVVVLAVVADPWVALAGAVVALVARAGQTEAFFRWGQLIRGFQPLRRKATYVRELATSTRAAKEIRTLGLLDWLDERYATENRAVLDPLWRWRRRVYGVPFVTYTVVALAGSVVALVLMAQSASAGQVGAAAVAVQALVLCARFGVMFPESDVKLVYGRSAWEALLEFEALAEADAGNVAPPSEGRVTPTSAISLREVRFGYRADRPVLDGLDLELAVGTSTALVGVNGAGKTTLVKLLTGLYRPDAGTVDVDGVDLRDLDVHAWQRTFAITFQDYLRYELPLRENVAMGAIEHRDDDAGIEAEVRRVGLGDVLDGLPLGLDTPLTRGLPGGRDLSGGQWQRLALARSLFAVRHGASVLVLDEPTAQLDARGEAEFYDQFLDLTRGVTSLVISHRFSSVRRADRIVVLDGGRVTEAGSHDELVHLGGTYARMFEVQARRFSGPAGQGADTPDEQDEQMGTVQA